MVYDVRQLAQEFTIDPAALEETFVVFFAEAAILLEKSESALEQPDYESIQP